MNDLNTCDKCGDSFDTFSLTWIDTEDFKPLKEDKFSKYKHNKAIKKGISALCEDCYFKECCLK